jgi:hypothetical protein
VIGGGGPQFHSGDGLLGYGTGLSGTTVVSTMGYGCPGTVDVI